MIEYTIYPPSRLNNAEIEKALFLFEELFIPKLSERINLIEYSLKLSTNATSIIAKNENEIIGLCSFYCNPNELSYLNLLVVSKQFQGNNIAHVFITKMINICTEKSSNGIDLEMHATNLKLLNLYSSFGFCIKDSFTSIDGHYKYHLRLRFDRQVIKHFPFIETPVSYQEKISKIFANDIYIKQDDCFPIAQGGNKARKLQYILFRAKFEGYTAVVSAGDINSNHNRATALMCARLGLKVKLIIHNDHPENESRSINMHMIRLSGANVIYCSKNDVKKTMDNAMIDFKNQGFTPFYIYGGGHCLEGTYAYYDAVANLKRQINFQPDYVFFASGTGTTHAGLHVGMKDFFPDAKVIGISIARERNVGIDKIHESIIELEKYLEKPFFSPKESISFDDSFIGCGYESIVREVEELIRDVATLEGLLLDPTYSGKAFWGMKMLLSQYNIKNKKILFWNTGGIYNLLSSTIR